MARPRQIVYSVTVHISTCTSKQTGSTSVRAQHFSVKGVDCLHYTGRSWNIYRIICKWIFLNPRACTCNNILFFYFILCPNKQKLNNTVKYVSQWVDTLRTVSYLALIKEHVLKGHLSHRDTLSQILNVPSRQVSLYKSVGIIHVHVIWTESLHIKYVVDKW